MLFCGRIYLGRFYKRWLHLGRFYLRRFYQRGRRHNTAGNNPHFLSDQPHNFLHCNL
jgi:hypothetical protein